MFEVIGFRVSGKLRQQIRAGAKSAKVSPSVYCKRILSYVHEQAPSENLLMVNKIIELQDKQIATAQYTLDRGKEVLQKYKDAIRAQMRTHAVLNETLLRVESVNEAQVIQN